MPADGYYWARISQRGGEPEIVEISTVTYQDGSQGCIVSIMGDEQTLELDQIEIVKAIPAFNDGT